MALLPRRRKKAAKKRAKKKAAAPQALKGSSFYFRAREQSEDGSLPYYRVVGGVPTLPGGGDDFSGFDDGIPVGAWARWTGSAWEKCERPSSVRHTKFPPEV